MSWRARISAERLIVAAASARPFVRAARASGREVVAADVFCDMDTRCNAIQTVQLDYRLGGFDGDDVRRKLFPLLSPETAFVYGSGFETQPQLLDEIAQRCRLVGNTAETVRILKDPGRFFSCLESLRLPFPETVMQLRAGAGDWLSKRIGGSGGTHVSCSPGGEMHYYQRALPGRPYSLLFLADGVDAAAVGYNEQWTAPVPGMPWRYGGGVSHAVLPQPVRDAMLSAARRLTLEFGLRGLNSLDCMVDGERWWILEINPRLSATFVLYDANSAGAHLFEAHLRACAGELHLAMQPESSRAHLIYYAASDIKIPAVMEWPEWVADIPMPESMIRAGEPLCSILATAGNAAAAAALAHQYAGGLSRRIHLMNAGKMK